MVPGVCYAKNVWQTTAGGAFPLLSLKPRFPPFPFIAHYHSLAPYLLAFAVPFVGFRFGSGFVVGFWRLL